MPPELRITLSKSSSRPSAKVSLWRWSPKSVIFRTLVPHRSCTPDSDISLSRHLTICIASWEHGNTQPSSCVVNRMPSFSNHANKSLAEKDLRRRFIRFVPRGYTSFRLRTCSNELVMLHLPPPVTASLAIGLLAASKTVIFQSGCRLCSKMDVKQPDAPAPMIAVDFIRSYFLQI